jgi:hypothetical protein
VWLARLRAVPNLLLFLCHKHHWLLEQAEVLLIERGICLRDCLEKSDFIECSETSKISNNPAAATAFCYWRDSRRKLVGANSETYFTQCGVHYYWWRRGSWVFVGF